MLWEGHVDEQGYGVRKVRGKRQRVHRLMWQKYRGEIESGKELHHLCGNKRCCNPEHLELVTRKEHVAKTPSNVVWLNKGKTHCAHGHEFTPENTYLRTDGSRQCRICINLSMRQWRRRRRDRECISVSSVA